MIENQLTLMQSFVDDLLDLKQLAEGAFSLVERAFNPETVLRSVCAVLEPQSLAKGVKLSFKIESSLHPPNLRKRRSKLKSKVFGGAKQQAIISDSEPSVEHCDSISISHMTKLFPKMVIGDSRRF